MVKKLFALASVSALTGLVAAVGASGCTTETVETTAGDGDAGVTKEAGTKDRTTPDPVDEKDAETEVSPSKTTGKECQSLTDCHVDGTDNGNVCTKGLFTDGDLLGTPVCVGQCVPAENAKTVKDLLCDGETGVCLGQDGQGTCFGRCEYDSTTLAVPCAGNNKCTPAYGLTKQDGMGAILGFCFAACAADADCKGTSGQKCQKETGLCLNEAAYKTYSKAVGEACKADECNCNTVGGEGPDKDKGYCGHVCVTGAAGDEACDALAGGWKCTVGLSRKSSDGKDAFTGQPDDVVGVCAQPCETVDDCAGLATATGLAGGEKGAGTFECVEFSNGKFCSLTEVE